MNIPVRSTLNAVVAQAVGKGLAIGTWAALVAWAARELPAADYGEFMLLANLAMLALLIGSYGLPQVILHLNGRLASNTRSPRHHAAFWLCVRLMAPTSIVVALGLSLATLMSQDNSVMPVFLSLAYGVWVLGGIWQAFMAEEAKTVSKFWIAGLFSNSGAVGGQPRSA